MTKQEKQTCFVNTCILQRPHTWRLKNIHTCRTSCFPLNCIVEVISMHDIVSTLRKEILFDNKTIAWTLPAEMICWWKYCCVQILLVVYANDGNIYGKLYVFGYVWQVWNQSMPCLDWMFSKRRQLLAICLHTRNTVTYLVMFWKVWDPYLIFGLH